MEKTIDLAQIGLNGTLGYIMLNVSFTEHYAVWLNIIPALFGFLWVFIERLPKAVFFLNKTWLGLKATRNGQELKKEDYLNEKQNDENQ